MADLQDFQFELDGAMWGIGLPVSVDAGGFDRGSVETISQDSDNPLSDGSMVGRDLVRGETWLWNGHTDQYDVDTALDALEDLETVWANQQRRRVVGDVRALRYRLNGRTRRVYGRPRNFAAPMDNRLLGGMVPITMDFKKVDPLHYDDVEQVVTVQAAASKSSGFTAPFKAPVSTVGATSAARTITVGGRAETAPIIEIKGPGNNAGVVIGDARVDLVGSLASNDTVVIDCRPWAMSMRLNGAPVASSRLRLSRRTDLTAVRLQPGTHTVALLIVDNSGQARATVRWRNANVSI